MTQEEINRQFDRMMYTEGYSHSIAATLNTFLLAAPGAHRPDEEAVTYALGRLWTKKGSSHEA